MNADPEIVKDTILDIAFARSTLGKCFIDPKVSANDGLEEDALVFPSFALPKLPKQISAEFATNNLDKDLQSLVQRLWDGKDLMAWYFAGEYNDRPAVFVDIQWRADEHAEDSVCTFIHFADDVDFRPLSAADLQMPFLYEFFSSDSLVLLETRVVHWFVRSLYSSNVPNWFDVTIAIPQFLLDTYTEEKRWKDYYDIATIKSKIELESYNSSTDNERTREARFVSYKYVSDALMAMKAFEEAGEFLRQASEKFSLSVDNGEQNIMLTVIAGTAMREGGKHKESEKMYFEALRKQNSVLRTAGKSCFDPNGTVENVLWNLLIDLYRATRDDKLAMTLLALLLRSGWTKPDCVSSPSIIAELPNRVLPTQHQASSTAKAVLFSIFGTSESVETIRHALLSVTGSKADMWKLGRSRDLTAEGGREFYDMCEPSGEKHARELLEGRKRSGKMLPKCCACGNAPERDLRCPCGVVNYCSQECQRIDWKARHKKMCPWQRKKKKLPVAM